jgi:hypothetical protein
MEKTDFDKLARPDETRGAREVDPPNTQSEPPQPNPDK